MWILVGQWEKDGDNKEEIMRQVGQTMHRWHELALDVGLDPEKNVTIAENETEIRIGISQEMRSFYRGVPEQKLG